MKIKKIIKKIWRYPLCTYYRKKLKNNRFSIISSDCIGGVLYHDLGCKFTSPTINLIVPEFLIFVKSLKHYIEVEPIPAGYSKKGEPIIMLDNIEIIGVHYHNHVELINKWNERKLRINWNNIVLISSDKFIKTTLEKEEFANLPFPKLLFTGKRPTNAFEIFIPKMSKKLSIDLTSYCDLLGRRIFEKYVNCVEFLNKSVEYTNEK